MSLVYNTFSRYIGNVPFQMCFWCCMGNTTHFSFDPPTQNHLKKFISCLNGSIYLNCTCKSYTDHEMSYIYTPMLLVTATCETGPNILTVLLEYINFINLILSGNVALGLHYHILHFKPNYNQVSVFCLNLLPQSTTQI